MLSQKTSQDLKTVMLLDEVKEVMKDNGIMLPKNQNKALTKVKDFEEKMKELKTSMVRN